WARCWGESEHFGGGREWTFRRLESLFDAYYPCTSIVTMRARRLLELHRRWSRAEKCLAYARRLLCPSIQDWRQASLRGDDVRGGDGDKGRSARAVFIRTKPLSPRATAGKRGAA